MDKHKWKVSRKALSRDLRRMKAAADALAAGKLLPGTFGKGVVNKEGTRVSSSLEDVEDLESEDDD